MKSIRFFLTFILAFAAVCAAAQDIKVTGKVTDSSTGESVPFASIRLKGTTTGGNTDADGV